MAHFKYVYIWRGEEEIRVKKPSPLDFLVQCTLYTTISCVLYLLNSSLKVVFLFHSCMGSAKNYVIISIIQVYLLRQNYVKINLCLPHFSLKKHAIKNSRISLHVL